MTRDDEGHRALFALLFLALFWICLGCCHGCSSSNAGEAPLDMGVSQSVDQHPERCRGPQDSGKVIWWVFRPDQGINELVLEPVEAIVRQVGSKYVCKNHAKEQHGFWWEQSR